LKHIQAKEARSEEGKHRRTKSGLKRAREGKITTVPLNERKADHLSRIDGRDNFGRDSDLERRHNTRKSKVKEKYLKKY